MSMAVRDVRERKNECQTSVCLVCLIGCHSIHRQVVAVKFRVKLQIKEICLDLCLSQRNKYQIGNWNGKNNNNAVGE